jgi:histidine ammonia-lyase
MELGVHRLSIEDVVRVARGGKPVTIVAAARSRMALGRRRLEKLLARGERIYGVNTGIGGNVGISLAPDQMEPLQHNLMRELGCATGQPLPPDVVRAATLLRIATFLSGASAVRPELVDALAELLNRGVTPVVPRYGSVGASGDLMPSAEALAAAGLAPMRFASKEWKIDFASMGNWGNALMALLVDDRFNDGLPANLTPQPGVNSGYKGMRLSITSLACAVRQMAGPRSIRRGHGDGRARMRPQSDRDAVDGGRAGGGSARRSGTWAMDRGVCTMPSAGLSILSSGTGLRSAKWRNWRQICRVSATGLLACRLRLITYAALYQIGS